MQRVQVMTAAELQKDGSFIKQIHAVYASIESARAEMQRIADTFNSEDGLYKDWRAETPIGQVDALSLERLEGNHYQCQTFYKIRPYNVIAE
jgi:hypothetical protein